MSVKGLVLSERAYLGDVTPPDTFEDESRFKNDGVHTNIEWVQLPSGLWVRSFNGSSSFINLGQPASLSFGSGDWSIGCWFKTTVIGHHVLIMKGYSGGGARTYQLEFRDERLKLLVLDGTLIKSVLAGVGEHNDNEWHSGFGVRDGNNLRLFVDGAEHANSPTDITGLGSLDQANNFNIGRHSDAAVWWHTGYIALPYARRYALSAEEIAAKFQSQKHWFGK